jgi:large subunit ribosomal protein L33
VGERVRVALACEECGARNYHTTKAPKYGGSDKKAKGGDAARSPIGGVESPRLEMKKFCPGCGKHTVHRESK